MRKIKAEVKNNDRITIALASGYIHFYYEAAKQNRKEYLYSMNFSGSVFDYFRHNGITISEMYKFNDWHNPKLAKVMDRLPKAIDYALKETSREVTYVHKKTEAQR